MKRGDVLRAGALSVLLGFGATACVGSSAPDAGAMVDDGESSESEADTGEHEPPGACGESAACSLEDVCTVTECGGKAASISHFGCERVSCTSDDDCDPTEACYPRALGGSCLASSVTCTVDAEAGACTCEESTDCAGTLGAHCIPHGFYPVEEYCDTEPFACGELSDWQAAVREASSHHLAAGADQLATRLSGCSETITQTRLSCGESPCAVVCSLSVCGEATPDCTAACEAAGFDGGDLASLAATLSSSIEGTCACEVCDPGMPCAAVWSC